jgi:hypothetical protein
MSTPLIPEYPKMVQSVFDHLSWDARDFAAYRFSMRYPPIPAVCVVSFPLAERST